jgi:hypothetical protein
MADLLNQITYGNLNQNLLDTLKSNCIADKVLPILDKEYKTILSFPLNDSATTKDELNTLVNNINSIKSDENKKHLSRFFRYDKSLQQAIITTFSEKGINVEELVSTVSGDIGSTIIKLKQKYQRPRPYQLAQYYKLKLFPFASTSAHSPSYPSGHTIQAYVILNIIGNKFPQTFNFCKKMIDDVANSRVYLGLHYPSDNDASYLIGREILKLKSFTEKYKI